MGSADAGHWREHPTVKLFVPRTTDHPGPVQRRLFTGFTGLPLNRDASTGC